MSIGSAKTNDDHHRQENVVAVHDNVLYGDDSITSIIIVYYASWQDI